MKYYEEFICCIFRREIIQLNNFTISDTKIILSQAAETSKWNQNIVLYVFQRPFKLSNSFSEICHLICGAIMMVWVMVEISFRSVLTRAQVKVKFVALVLAAKSLLTGQRSVDNTVSNIQNIQRKQKLCLCIVRKMVPFIPALEKL